MIISVIYFRHPKKRVDGASRVGSRDHKPSYSYRDHMTSFAFDWPQSEGILSLDNACPYLVEKKSVFLRTPLRIGCQMVE